MSCLHPKPIAQVFTVIVPNFIFLVALTNDLSSYSFTVVICLIPLKLELYKSRDLFTTEFSELKLVSLEMLNKYL